VKVKVLSSRPELGTVMATGPTRATGALGWRKSARAGDGSRVNKASNANSQRTQPIAGPFDLRLASATIIFPALFSFCFQRPLKVAVNHCYSPKKPSFPRTWRGVEKRGILNNYRHVGESRYPERVEFIDADWTPASAGVTACFSTPC
jgi:hypothetical protein